MVTRCTLDYDFLVKPHNLQVSHISPYPWYALPFIFSYLTGVKIRTWANHSWRKQTRKLGLVQRKAFYLSIYQSIYIFLVMYLSIYLSIYIHTYMSLSLSLIIFSWPSVIFSLSLYSRMSFILILKILFVAVKHTWNIKLMLIIFCFQQQHPKEFREEYIKEKK